MSDLDDAYFVLCLKAIQFIPSPDEGFKLLGGITMCRIYEARPPLASGLARELPGKEATLVLDDTIDTFL